ncbi:MAG TPA: hypothetical protein VHP58_01020 [Alphaproteobacteria bacterium]|nr:hypothetical protein [Alphaproteobacteria bacterium]
MKNTLTLCLMLAAALQAPAGYAIEKSSALPVTNADRAAKNSTSSFDGHNTSFLGTMNTSLTTVSNQVKNVENCNNQGKLWNGTTCWDPAADKPISTTAIYGPASTWYGTQANVTWLGGDCCAWYFSYTCTCSAAESAPTIRRYGNLVILEPRTCYSRGPGSVPALGKGYADPNGVALNWARGVCAAQP